MSVTRYGWEEPYCDEPSDFAEMSDGDYVHFSDYQKLVDALRLIYRLSTSENIDDIAEAALLSAGEEL